MTEQNNQVKELADQIKACGEYSIELDGYVINPTTVACKLSNAGYIKVVPIPDLEVSVLNAYCEQCNHKCADKVDEPCHEAQGNSAKVLSLVSQYLHQLAQGMEVISDDVMQAVKPTTGEWHQYENEHGAKTADPKASFMACWIEKMLQAQLTADKEAMERG